MDWLRYQAFRLRKDGSPRQEARPTRIRLYNERAGAENAQPHHANHAVMLREREEKADAVRAKIVALEKQLERANKELQEVYQLPEGG
jgi:hypothetical protein